MKKKTVILLAILCILNACKNDEFTNDQLIKSDYENKQGVGSSDGYGCEDLINVYTGEGYSNIYSESYPTYNYRITSNTSFSTFKNIAEKLANSGDIIYIESNVEMILLGNIQVRDGVKIVSNRGQVINGVTSTGATLINGFNDASFYCFTDVNGGVQFSGIRFEGSNENTHYEASQCIRATDVTIANCEFRNWHNAAITLNGGTNYIHDSYIYKNTSYNGSCGYGILVGSGYAEIYNNICDSNRHHITGVGNDNCSYHAFNNLFDKTSDSGHALDMHPWGHIPSEESFGKEFTAGNKIIIEHNTFQNNVATNIILIRGVPETGCFIYNNKFCNNTISAETISQNGEIGNFYCYNNSFDYYIPKWQLYSRQVWGWAVADFGEVTPLSGIKVGDFDGDGRDEIFRTKLVYKANKYEDWLEKEWLITNYTNDFTNLPTEITIAGSNHLNSWKKLNTSIVDFSKLALADFDGDDRDDVFTSQGGEWYISKSGKGTWKCINGSSVPFEDLYFGYFNDNKTVDVIRNESANGKYKWYVSYEGRGPWTYFGETTTPIQNLRFYDFDGDGLTDIFRKLGDVFQIVYSSNGYDDYTSCGSTIKPIEELRFGDFDGNGTDDIFKIENNVWMVCYSSLKPKDIGFSSWTTKWDTDWTVFSGSSVPLSNLIFGKFDNDQKTDILTVW